jgi:hypothetical protein
VIAWFSTRSNTFAKKLLEGETPEQAKKRMMDDITDLIVTKPDHLNVCEWRNEVLNAELMYIT